MAGTHMSQKAICRLPFLLIATLAAIAGLVLYCFDPSYCSGYPVCRFHQATGLLCPGCGSLRALHQLLHGHWAAAFRFNPLLVSSLPLVAWLAGRAAAKLWRGQSAAIAIHPAWLWGGLAVSLAFGILRNLHLAL
jgi:hypothetical protein